MDELNELKSKIAKEKGYTHVIGKMDAASRYPMEYWLVGNSKTSVLPDWTGDISAAWELVEEMRQAGYPVAIMAIPEEYERHNMHEAKVYQKNGAKSLVYEYGTTPAAAICEAYISWQEAVRQEAQP
jgi:hypothetical protein